MRIYFSRLQLAFRESRMVMPLAIIFLLAGSLGVHYIFLSHAATSATSAEAESGSLSGNTNINSDSNASGGSAVVFGLGGSGSSYYIDCTSGSDSNTGTSQASAWLTLTKANAAQLSSGDRLLFKRSCTWTGSLAVKWTGVTISNYGSGSLPVIQSSTNNTNIVSISGPNNIIDGVQAVAKAPSTDPNCGNNPVGHVVGFYFPSGAANNTVRNSVATGGYAGVYINFGAHNNQILNNQLTNNTMMSPLDPAPNNDAGAFGVLLWGNNNEIAWNQINGSDACSYDYTRDGSAVEVFNGSSNNVHNNTAINDNTFTELGKDSSHTSDGNTFAYNLFMTNVVNGIFLNTRGSGSSYGPITNTKVYNNTAYVTGSSSPGGVICSDCGPTILTLKNNIIWDNVKALYTSAAFIESNNIYWAANGNPLIQGITINSTSKRANPMFMSPGSDFHLLSGSPAIDAGTNESVSAGYNRDLDNHVVPFGAGVDIGGYEFQ